MTIKRWQQVVTSESAALATQVMAFCLTNRLKGAHNGMSTWMNSYHDNWKQGCWYFPRTGRYTVSLSHRYRSFQPMGCHRGTPSLKLGTVNQTVETFWYGRILKPGHTPKGNMRLRKLWPNSITTADEVNPTPPKLIWPFHSLAVKSAQSDADEEGKRGSSANTIVVFENEKVGSGNLLVVKQGVQASSWFW